MQRPWGKEVTADISADLMFAELLLSGEPYKSLNVPNTHTCAKFGCVRIARCLAAARCSLARCSLHAHSLAHWLTRSLARSHTHTT